jgi:two-component system chemotaxis response regulator CheB
VTATHGATRPAAAEARPSAFDLVVMVASLGGLQSASVVLAGLPGDFPVPILLLQHAVRRDSPEVLAGLLQRSTRLPVHTADDNEQMGGPGVSVLPRGHTAALSGDTRLRLRSVSERGGGGDALLTSAAEHTAGRMIAVVLTGMLDDGARGVRAVKRHGGRVLAEDPRTARASSMPAHAVATGCVDFTLPNHRIAAALLTLAVAPGGAELFTVPTPAWASLDG